MSEIEELRERVREMSGPKRIWAGKYPGNGEHDWSVDAGWRGTYTEYIRADLHQATEAKLATCEKYRDAYAECDRIGTQAVRDLEAKVEAMRGALERIGEGRFGTTSHARDIAIAALREARNG